MAAIWNACGDIAEASLEFIRGKCSSTMYCSDVILILVLCCCCGGCSVVTGLCCRQRWERIREKMKDDEDEEAFQEYLRLKAARE